VNGVEFAGWGWVPAADGLDVVAPRVGICAVAEVDANDLIPNGVAAGGEVELCVGQAGVALAVAVGDAVLFCRVGCPLSTSTSPPAS